MFNIQNYGSFIMVVILFQLIPGAGYHHNFKIVGPRRRRGRYAGR